MMVNFDELKGVIEGLLFVAGDQGMDVMTLAQIVEQDAELVEDLVHDLQADYKRMQRGLQIIEIAGSFQLTTLAEHAVYFERLAFSPSSLNTVSGSFRNPRYCCVQAAHHKS